jgi:hypothetical protein
MQDCSAGLPQSNLADTGHCGLWALRLPRQSVAAALRVSYNTWVNTRSFIAAALQIPTTPCGQHLQLICRSWSRCGTKFSAISSLAHRLSPQTCLIDRKPRYGVFCLTRNPSVLKKFITAGAAVWVLLYDETILINLFSKVPGLLLNNILQI